MDGLPHALVGGGESGGLRSHVGGSACGAALIYVEVVGGGVLHIEHHIGEILPVLVHRGGKTNAPSEAAACTDAVGEGAVAAIVYRVAQHARSAAAAAGGNGLYHPRGVETTSRSCIYGHQCAKIYQTAVAVASVVAHGGGIGDP